MEVQWGWPHQSLWSLIVDHVPDSELPEIRGVLGETLVDMYTEVHSEVEMWREIWQGTHQGSNHSNAPGTPCSRRQGSPLADPPAVKELLRAEIQMLLQSVREKANREGRDGEEVLSRYDPDTVNYALGHSNGSGRPSNRSYPGNRPGPGNTNAGQRGSRPASCASIQSGASDEIDAVKDRLNVSDIDQVVAHLRSVLTEECEALKSQVLYLQEGIEQEYRSQYELDQTEPTVTELREQRRAIQMDLELPSPRLTSPSSSSSSSSSSLMEDLANRSRYAEQRTLDKPLRPLTLASTLRPRPSPPLSHVKPSPPLGTPPTETSAPVRPVHTTALARTQGQQVSLPTSSEPSLTHGSVHRARNPHRPLSPMHGSDQLIPNSKYRSSPCPEHERLNLTAGCHYGNLKSSPNVQLEAKGNSRLSSHRRSLSRSTECALTPQTDRKNSPLLVRRSGNRDDVPSLIPPLRDANCTQSPFGWWNNFCSSNNNGHSILATGRTKTHDGQRNSTCGSNLASTTEEIQAQSGRRNSISESFLCNVMNKHSVSATGGPHTQNGSDNNTASHSVPVTDGLKTQNGSRKNISNSHLGKDLTEELSNSSPSPANQTPSVCQHHSAISGTQRRPAYTQRVSIHTFQTFTSPKIPLGGTTSQEAKTQKFPTTSFQPVPPAVQKASSRGQRLTRRMGVQQGDSLVKL